MFHKNATMAFGVIALLTVCSAQEQRVPVADGAIADQEWPTVGEIGVPLYPDLKAYMTGTPPLGPPAGDKDAFRFVNFTSQADVPTLLAWYGEHAEGWVVDADMEMLFPEGADIHTAMMMLGQSPFVSVMDMTEGAAGICMNVPCKSMVQVVYKPEQ